MLYCTIKPNFLSSLASWIKIMKEDTAISLHLPPLPDNDPMLARKKIFDEMIQAVRILNMDETEIYFAGVDAVGPFSQRNELESLNSILSVIMSAFPCVINGGMELLQLLRNKTMDMIKSLGENNINGRMIEKYNSGPEELLLQWGKDHGVRTKLEIAHFEVGGRGAVAAENMDVGDTALEIPESLIICEDLLHESDMVYKLLSAN
ncbi:hypothetical protein ACLOJK_040535 [Asimina triloba]